MPILNGTSGNDTLNGTAGDDEINGLAGDDVLNGLDGNDTLDGGAGNDTLNGGAGDDTFLITGASANCDQVNGGSGADRILGGAGDDTFRFYSYSGANTVETIDGGAGVNIIAALAGFNSTIDLSGTQLLNIARIEGNTGNDTITGSAGNDVIVGGAGIDLMSGGGGDDVFIITGTAANHDQVNGGAGFDEVRGDTGDDTFRLPTFFGANTVEKIDGLGGVNVIAALAGYNSTIDLSGTQLFNIARIEGNTGNDTITGSAGNDVIVGGAGIDLMSGGGGDDVFIITGTAANHDQVNGGAGFDEVRGDTGDDTFRLPTFFGANTVEKIDGLGGVNVIAALAGYNSTIDLSGTQLFNIARIEGNTGNDTITGSAGNDVIDGGAGNDILNGGAGNDTLNGGTGVDALNGGLGDDAYVVDSAGDAISDTGGIDTVSTTLASYALASSLENLAYTGAGSFMGTGNSGSNTITGGGGADTLTGGGGNDTLRGGTGNDLYLFDTGFGQDVIEDNDPTAGNTDTIRFGAGIMSSSVAVSRAGLDLTLTKASESIIVRNWFASDAAVVERVEFADSTVWDAAQLRAMSDRTPTPTPVNTVPGVQTMNEDASLVFSVANGNAISVADGDSASLAVRVSVNAGTLVLGSTPGTLTITGNGSGTITLAGSTPDINTALNGLTYSPVVNANGPATLVIETGDGGTPTTGLTDTDNITINITPVNDSPTATNLSAAETYTEDTPLNLTDIVVSDVDSANVTATLTLSNIAAGSLSTATSGAVTSTYNAGTGVWTASGAVANVNALLAALAFNPAANFNSSFSIVTSVSDGVAPAVTGSKAMTGTPVNDAPVNTVPGAQTAAEDTNLTVNGISIADVDATGSMQVTLSSANGALTLSQSTGLTFTAGDGTSDASMTFTGALGNVNSALTGLTFRGNLNFNGAAGITLVTSDQGSSGSGGTLTDTDSITVNVTAVNDAPTATNLSAAETYTANTPLNLTDIVASDVDSANVTATLTLSNIAAGSLSTATSGAVTSTYNAGTGAWTASGAIADVNALLAGVTYNPAPNFNSSFTIATSVSDGVAAPITGSKAVTAALVDLPPVVVNPFPNQTYTEDTPLNLNDIVVNDLDSANVTATLTLSNIAAGSLSTATSGGVTSTYNAGTGAWAASGAVASVNALLAAVTFNPAANFNSNFSIATSVSDGVAPAVTGSKAMTGTPVNDAPVNTVPGAQTAAEDTNLTVNGISIADVDATGSMQVTLSSANGALTLSQSTGLTFTAGDGTADATMTFTGALNAVNSALGGLIFRGNLNFNGAAGITLVTSDQGSSGSGGTLTDTDSIPVTVTAVNDAPVLNAAATPTLTAVAEDAAVPTGAVGSLVSALVNLNPPAGGLDNVTDPDVSPVAGIALTATGGSGTWYYSTDNGGTWNTVGVVNASNSLLLRDVDRLYFQPAANFNGTVPNTITFCAWDQTGATLNQQGTRVSTTATGGQTPFSTATDTADIAVTAVNDLPVISGLGSTVNYGAGATGTVIDSSITVTDVDNPNLARVTVSITSGFITGDVLNFTNQNGISGSYGSGTLTLTGSATIADYKAALESITFSTGGSTTAGTRTIAFTADDDLAAPLGPPSSPAAFVNVTIGGPNNNSVDLTTLNGTINFTGGDGFIMGGLEVDDQAGRAVRAAGDVNGDGFDDIIVGAFSAKAPGATSLNKNSAGMSYVVFGKASGFGNFGLDTLNGTTGFKINGTQSSERTGYSVASAGDVNGDGFADLIIGSRDNNNLTTKAYVVFGSSTFSANFNLSGINGTNGFALINIDNDNTDFIRVGPGGDVNGDGFDDVIVGNPDGDPIGSNNGQAFVIFGKASFASTPTIDPNTMAAATGFQLNSATNSRRAGASVTTAGDFNGDGFNDIVVGDKTVGRAYIYFGKATGFGAVALEGLTGGATGGFEARTSNPSNFGYSTSLAGDVNGDGFDDWVIGAPATGGGVSNAYVIFGRASVSANMNVSTTALDGTTGFRIITSVPAPGTSYGFLGTSASTAGDFNGDGFDDLIIGAPAAPTITGTPGPGEAYIIFGKASFAATPTIDTSTLSTTDGIKLVATTGNDQTGKSVSAAGDINGDGFDDVIVGANLNDPGAVDAAGASYVLFGEPSGALAFDGRLAGSGQTFTGSGTIVGSAFNDTLTGSAGADVLVGGRGNDILVGGGGADTLRGAAGNDTITFAAGLRAADGGSGIDTLSFGGSGQTLDLTQAANRIFSGFERIDITGTGNNTLTLDVFDVLDLANAKIPGLLQGLVAAPDVAAAVSNQAHILIVEGNSGDTVNGTGGWTRVTGAEASVNDGVHNYSHYVQGTAHLLVEQDSMTLQNLP